MRWNHLPVAGGLYDQHPKFIDDMTVIFEEKSKHEAAEAEKQKRQAAKSSRSGRRGR